MKIFLKGGNFIAYIHNKNSNTVVNGTAHNDTIDGDAGNDIIFGGDGSDSIFGGAGDDELYGDGGANVFYYKPGEGIDTIFGYEASVDKIILASGTISNKTSDRNNNVIFSVGDGQLVIHEGADRTIEIVDTSGKAVDNGVWKS